MKAAALANSTKEKGCWRDFKPGNWCNAVDVRDFIVCNVTPYTGDQTFLAGPSKRTKAVWAKLQPFFQDERKRGVLAVDAKTPSTMLAHKAGYIDRGNEVVVGLQTDEPFKRAIFPFGGLRMVEAGLKAAGIEADPQVHQAFTKYRKSHNDGVFDAYTPEIMRCRRSGIITGLPELLWPRPDYRRLPPRRALWRRAPDERQAAGTRADLMTCGRPAQRPIANVRGLWQHHGNPEVSYTISFFGLEFSFCCCRRYASVLI